MIGLGRLCANMVSRPLRAVHERAVSDMSTKAVEELADGGNSYYVDDMRHANEFAAKNRVRRAFGEAGKIVGGV